MATIRAEWSENDKKMFGLHKKAKNMLFIDLDEDLFENVVNYTITKEVRETLIVIHKGMEEVKENKQYLPLNNIKCLHASMEKTSLSLMRDTMSYLTLSNYIRHILTKILT